MITWTTSQLGPVKSWVAAAANEIGNLFGITRIGGWRRTDPYPDHPSGHALDFMTNTGTALAEYARVNAARLGVKYIIWNRQQWSVAKASQGWRPYTGSNPHTDHVHITFNPEPPVGGAIVTGVGNLGSNALSGLFNLDELMGKIRGTSITLLGALFGIGLIGAGLIIAVRQTSVKQVSKLMGGEN